MITFVLTDSGRAQSARPKQRYDCTVRALAVVTGLTYDQAYDALAICGRKPSRGFPFKELADNFNINGYALEWTPFQAVKGFPRMRIGVFVGCYPKGRYIVKVAGHVYAVIDGVPHDDDAPRESACIYGMWEAIRT